MHLRKIYRYTFKFDRQIKVTSSRNGHCYSCSFLEGIRSIRISLSQSTIPEAGKCDEKKKCSRYIIAVKQICKITAILEIVRETISMSFWNDFHQRIVTIT
jgi:hypothetical protein